MGSDFPWALPWHRHQIKLRTDRRLLVSPPKDTDWQSGVNGIVIFKFRSEKFSKVGFEPGRDRPVASPSQPSNPLGQRAPSVVLVLQ